jgi:hypothetical protein
MILIFILFIIPYSLCEGRSFFFFSYSLVFCLSIEWTIHVHTGNERFSGTDSNVFIRLFTSKRDRTDEYQLTHENWIIGNTDFPIRNLFETGAHDRFRIVTKDIGFIEKIQVRRLNIYILLLF